MYEMTRALVDSIPDRFKVVIADAGLLMREREVLQPSYDFAYKHYGDVRIQSKSYRELIAQRPRFLLTLFETEKHVLSMDADTEFIKDDLSLLDSSSDMTLSVRESQNVWGQYDPKYPNLGVVFYHNPKKCAPFVRRWEEITYSKEPLKTFEQGNFYRAMQEEEFKQLNVQYLHCKYYNCYETAWKNCKTSIIHKKTYSTVGERV